MDIEATDSVADDQQFFRYRGLFSKAKMRLHPGIQLMVHGALIFLSLVLVISLVIVATQCFQAKKSMNLEIKTLKDSLEKVNTTYNVLRQQHDSHKERLPNLENLQWESLLLPCDIKSWEEAEKFCVSQNSHLASVTSVGEQEFLYKTLKGERHWIGLNDRHTEDTWTWEDGTIYDAVQSKGFWIPGQPTNYQGKEDCVEIKIESLASWNDENCELKYKFICKSALGP